MNDVVMNETAASTEPCCAALFGEVLSEDEAADLASVLKALADPVRLRLVSLINASPSGELCACDLPELLGRSQPTMSHHLGQLVRTGILEREQRGKWAWFKVRPDRLAAIGAAISSDTAAHPSREARDVRPVT